MIYFAAFALGLMLVYAFRARRQRRELQAAWQADGLRVTVTRARYRLYVRSRYGLYVKVREWRRPHSARLVALLARDPDAMARFANAVTHEYLHRS